MPSDFKKFFELQYYLEKQFNKKIDLGLEKTLRSFIKDKSEIIYV
jgi:predicted nucleotidyltransferase